MNAAGRFAPLVALAAALAYLPSFAGAFQFDDYNVIVDYPTVHSWQALFERAGGGVRAVLKASYALNWTSGLGLFGFHLVNISLHALNAALLFLIGKTLFPRYPGAALAAALLFALHPAQTEAVTYVSGRSVSLMAALYLLSFFLYARNRHTASVPLFVLALATRETAVTLPVALLLYEICKSERPDWKAIARRQAPYWLIVGLGALVLLFSARYHELITYGFGRRGLSDNLVTQIGGVSYLVLQLVFPFRQNIDPALPTITALDPVLAGQAALLGVLLALGALNFRKRPWLAFGLVWFFLQLAPTNSLVPRLDVANDRQLYLACWGLFLALSVQVSRLEIPPTVPRGVTAVILAGLVFLSVARQLDYRDEVTLWEETVRGAPWNPRAHNNLGYAYYLAGRQAEAQREMRIALALDPAYLKARANLRLLDWK
jgi:tetratricopeptide (TPR) repeat protein